MYWSKHLLKVIPTLGLLGLGELTLAEDSAHSTQRTGVATHNTTRAPCPTQIFDQIRANDTQGGWLGLLTGIKTSEACANHVRSYLDSPAELEKVLAGNSTLQLGPERPAGHIDACLADYTKRPRNCRGPNCSKNMSVEQQSAAVADYYYLMNRLKMSSVSGLESIAGIDRMLGTPFMKDVSPVSNSDIPSAGDAFSELQSNPNCRRQNHKELDVIAEQTRHALMTLRMARQKKNANQVKENPKCARNCKWKVRDPALQAQLEGIEASLLRSFPWLQSETFASIVERQNPAPSPRGRGHSGLAPKAPIDYWSVDNLKTSLTQHFTKTREALISHHNKVIEASRCIHGSGGKNCIRKHLDTFASTPELDVPAMLTQNRTEARASGEWDRKTFSALAELGAGPCRQGIREAKRDMAHVMNDLVLNVGLTAVTFGASAYATAALKSAQLAQGAANGGKAIHALSSASRLPRAAQVAVAVSIGADAAWLGPSGSEVLNQCTGEAEQKIGADYREASVEGKVSCSNDQAKQLAAVSESRNCVMAAALAAMDALPLVPPLAARFSKAKPSIVAAAPSEMPPSVTPTHTQAPIPTPTVTSTTPPLPTSSPDALAAEVKRIEEMTPTQREAYAEDLLKNYSSHSKDPKGEDLLSGKYTSEVLIASAWNSGRRLNEAISAGTDPRRAFIENFEAVRARLSSSPAHGKYSGQDVLDVSQEIQKFLKAEGYNGNATLSGSFVNGFARQADGSDIDIMLPMDAPPELRDKLSSHIKSYLDQKLPHMDLHVDASFDVMREGQRLNNGVMIDINAQSQTLVSNPGSYVRNADGRRTSNLSPSGRYPLIQPLVHTPTDRSGPVAAATVERAGTTYKASQSLDVSKMEPGVYPYIVDSSGDLTFAHRVADLSGERSLVKHDSLLRKVASDKGVEASNVEVLAAGEIRVEVGASGKPEIVAISNKSGSFRGSEEHLSHATRELEKRGVDTSQISTRDYSRRQAGDHASELEVVDAIRKVRSDPQLLAASNELRQFQSDLLRRYPELRGHNGLIDTNKMAELPAFSRRFYADPMTDADFQVLEEFSQHKFMLDMMAESGSEFAVLASRDRDVKKVREFFERELGSTHAPSSLPQGRAASQSMDTNGLELIHRNRAWREGLPLDVQKKTDHRLSEFEKMRGQVEFSEGGSHFTLTPNGYPIIKIDSALKNDPAQLGQVLAHELDHFMRYERYVQRAAHDISDPSIRALTRTRLPAPGHVNLIGNLEDKAVELEQEIVRFRMNTNNQRLHEINGSVLGRLLNPNRARLGQQLEKDARYMQTLGLYPDQEVLRRLVTTPNFDPLIRDRRMDLAMDKIVERVMDARIKAHPGKMISDAEIIQDFETAFKYLSDKKSPTDAKSIRGLTDENYTDLRLLFFERAAHKYGAQLDPDALEVATELKKSKLRQSLSNLDRTPSNTPSVSTDSVSSPVRSSAATENIRRNFSNSHLSTIKSIEPQPQSVGEFRIVTNSGDYNDAKKLRDEFLNGTENLQPLRARLYQRGKVTGFASAHKESGWRFDVDSKDNIPHINVWKTVDGVKQSIRIDMHNLREEELQRLIHSLDSRF